MNYGAIDSGDYTKGEAKQVTILRKARQAMNTIEMELPITPTAQKRVRFFSRGKFSKTYKDKEQVKNEDFLMTYLKPYVPDKPMTGAIELTVLMSFPIPVSKPTWWKDAAINMRVKHTKKPDVSNIIKNIEDCMQTMGFYRDDSQIFRIIALKDYDLKGRWWIMLREYNEPQSKKEYIADFNEFEANNGNG